MIVESDDEQIELSAADVERLRAALEPLRTSIAEPLNRVIAESFRPLAEARMRLLTDVMDPIRRSIAESLKPIADAQARSLALNVRPFRFDGVSGLGETLAGAARLDLSDRVAALADLGPMPTMVTYGQQTVEALLDIVELDRAILERFDAQDAAATERDISQRRVNLVTVGLMILSVLIAIAALVVPIVR